MHILSIYADRAKKITSTNKNTISLHFLGFRRDLDRPMVLGTPMVASVTTSLTTSLQISNTERDGMSRTLTTFNKGVSQPPLAPLIDLVIFSS
jgi:hypothetical protein